MVNRGLTPNIIHCCAIYPQSLILILQPSVDYKMPKAIIGYSGHESPSDHTISCYAQLLGATLFEQHGFRKCMQVYQTTIIVLIL